MTVINRYPSITSEKDLKTLAYEAYLLLNAKNLQSQKHDSILIDNENNSSTNRKLVEAT